MVIPMNYVGRPQFVLKPLKMPGKVSGWQREDVGIGEKTLETLTGEKVDAGNAGPDVSVEETTATAMMGVNFGGEDSAHNDECNVSDASATEDDADESADSSLCTHYALQFNPSVQNAEAQARSSLLPGPSSLQPVPDDSKPTPSYHPGSRIKMSDTRVMCAGKHLHGVEI